MSNLYQDAILDAKALRASAMANAKAALEEAFEPKIQEMISKHLAEDAGEEEEIEESYGTEEEGKMQHEEGADINEAELEEILNQLEEMSKPEVEESLNEAEEEGEEGEEEEEEEEEEDGAAEESEAGTPDKDTKVVELTVGELMSMINAARDEQQGAMADEMPGEEEMPAAEEEPTADSEAEAEVSLEEILDELANDGIETEPGYGAARQTPPGGAEVEESTLYEKKHKKHDEENKELKEAKATIAELRKDLQEVNLLNAKYLYMNKLFKAKSLTESQKLKVINTLDRATTVKEVKNAYEIMNESFSVNKGQLKESIGFASKPAGVAPKANIVESEQFISRWQKLAGIKK